MFTGIEVRSQTAAADNAARREVEAAAKAAWHRGDRTAWRQAREQLAAMPGYRRPCGASTRQRIRATLRSALTAARREQLVTVNVAALVEMPPGESAKARVWTEGRVARWRATGEVPSSVMVWTPEQTAKFLDRAARHEFYALFLLLAFTGMRRGEAVGLCWTDIDVEAKSAQIVRQVVLIGWATQVKAPKTDAGSRTVMVTDEIVQELDVLRRRQQTARAAAGEAWTDTGFVFTRADGTHLHPAWASAWFKQLTREACLPPIRLHDLRHGAASLMLAAGVDIKVVADVLGHSGTGITRDIYTSVFAPLKWQAIDAVAALLAANKPTAPTTPARRQAGRSTASTNRAGAHRRSRSTTAGKEDRTGLSKV
ncbi:integrase [Catenulispora sp. GAS73]|uniref:site-specific integrase n=1 Tax=Catenulispora sp. GAS73 TaxID=3156269 RepID=UPI003511378F